MENIHVKNLTHLREVVREYEIYEYFEGPIVQGFNPECIYMAHLNFVG